MNILRIINDDDHMYDEKERRIKDVKVHLSKMTNIVYVRTESTESLEDRINSIKVKEFLEEIKKNNDEDIKDFYGTLGIDNASITNIKDIFNSVDYIEILLNDVDELEYINNNKEFLGNKKIIIEQLISINDFSKIKRLLKKYNEMKENICVELEYNYDPVNLVDCLKTMSLIKEEIDKIKKYNFSPMETIMYVYDKVRSRQYVKENKKESFTASRDLKNVLQGDKIVCVGYIKLFASILDNLGIKVNEDYLFNGYNRGHVRAAIYVKDEKYNIDGVSYLDPTHDRRYSDTYLDTMRRFNVKLDYDKLKYEYLSRYDYFAKTKNEVDKLYKHQYNSKSNPSSTKEFLKKITKIKISEENIELNSWIRKLCAYTNNEKINFNLFFDDVSDELIKKLDDIFSKINKSIPAQTMLDLLNNVRKVEYLEDNNVPYSVDNFKDIFVQSDWKFTGDDYRYCMQTYNLRSAIGIEQSTDVSTVLFDNYLSNSNIEEDIKNSKNKEFKLK